MRNVPSTKSGWWWLSFCDRSRPSGSQFIGVAIVEGTDLLDAIRAASHLSDDCGCNIGVEVSGGELPDITPVPEADRNRLLSRDRARELAKVS